VVLFLCRRNPRILTDPPQDEWVVAHVIFKSGYRFPLDNICNHPHFGNLLDYRDFVTYFTRNSKRIQRITQLYHFWSVHSAFPSAQDIENDDIFQNDIKKPRKNRKTVQEIEISVTSESDGEDEVPAPQIEVNTYFENDDEDGDVVLSVSDAGQEKPKPSGRTRMTRSQRRRQKQASGNVEAIELSSDSEPEGHEETRRDRAASISPPPQHARAVPQLRTKNTSLNQFAVTAFYFLRPQSRRRLFDPSTRRSRLDIDALRAKSDHSGRPNSNNSVENAAMAGEGERWNGPTLRDLLRFELLNHGDILHSVSKTRFGTSNRGNFGFLGQETDFFVFPASITASGRILSEGHLFGTFEEWKQWFGRPGRSIVWVRTDGTPLEELKQFHIFMKCESSPVYLPRNKRRVSSLWKGVVEEDILYENQVCFRDDFEAGIEIYKKEYGDVADSADENSTVSKNTPKKTSRKRKFDENVNGTAGRGRPKKIVKYVDDDDQNGPDVLLEPDRVALIAQRRAAQEEKKLKKLEQEIFDDLDAIQHSLPAAKSSGRPRPSGATSDRTKYGTDNGGDPFLDDAFANIPLFPVDEIIGAPPEPALPSLLK
jgi:hypothetical protein